ncbi:MAG TPA: MauE/DoxX family redox-associated membrane protein [Acidimicrobiales bacterium]|nr:MauE/DoxX family redox-associated membrane protein [Acidimicrobiales bacterium]
MLVVVRVGLAAVFVVAAVAKLRDPEGARRTVGAVGVPRAYQPAIAFLLSCAELAVGALLVLPGLGFIGAALASVLLAVFLAALTVQHLRGVDVPCACFGQLATTPAGWPTLARNAVLLAVALGALIAAH